VQALIATQIVAVIVAKSERSICAFPALDRVGKSCFRLGYTNVGFVENFELRADGGFWPQGDGPVAAGALARSGGATYD
jgi:hypothetical protein